MPQRQFSRRQMLLGTGAGVIGGSIAGVAAVHSREADSRAKEAPSVAVPATGDNQPGIIRLATPQTHGLIAVAALSMSESATTLARLGEKILELVDDAHPEVLPDGPGDLCVSVGVGQRVLDASPHDLDGLLDMPAFLGDDDLDPRFLGGDLLLGIYSSNPGDLDPVYAYLRTFIAGFDAHWTRTGFRGPGEDGVARNPLGYHDGVIVPRDDAKRASDLWIADGPLKNGTICVLRTFLIDVSAFRTLHPTDQDNVIGREKATGFPLGGSSLMEEANVVAKAPNGDFIIPPRAHVRAAHPSFTGTKLMMRRSYSFASPSGNDLEQGLLFIYFQNEVSVFSKTQQRLDELDALMDFSTPITTGAFAMLPGFDAEHPLGSSLFPPTA